MSLSLSGRYLAFRQVRCRGGGKGAVMWIRINTNDADPDPVSKKISQNHIKIDKNHQNIIFLKTEITLLFNANKYRLT